MTRGNWSIAFLLLGVVLSCCWWSTDSSYEAGYGQNAPPLHEYGEYKKKSLGIVYDSTTKEVDRGEETKKTPRKTSYYSSFSSTSPSPASSKRTRVKRWRITTAKGEVVDVQIEKGSDGIKVGMSLVGAPFCDQNKFASYFNSSELELIHKAELGPMEIIVEVHGASIQTMLAKSSDFCNHYYAVFQIPYTGAYRLKVFRLREDYAALRSIPEFPKMHVDVWIDEWIPNGLEKYVPKPCEGSNGYWVAKENSDNDNLLEKVLFAHNHKHTLFIHPLPASTLSYCQSISHSVFSNPKHSLFF